MHFEEGNRKYCFSDADTDGEEEMRLIIVRGNIKN